MRLVGEIMLLGIGLSVFWLQYRIQDSPSVAISKLIYWGMMLFLSIGFNCLLFNDYPQYYSFSNYFNRETLMLIVGVVVGLIILQIIAPSRPFVKLKAYFNNKHKVKENRKSNLEEMPRLGQDKKQVINTKEVHFEVFLQTVCYLAVFLVLLTELVFYGLDKTEVKEIQGLRELSCFMMMITMPIVIRQIIYHVYTIRDDQEQEEAKTNRALKKAFNYKLKKEHTRL